MSNSLTADYSQFRVIGVGEFGLNPRSLSYLALSQPLFFLLGTLVLLVAFNRGVN